MSSSGASGSGRATQARSATRVVVVDDQPLMTEHANRAANLRRLPRLLW